MHDHARQARRSTVPALEQGFVVLVVAFLVPTVGCGALGLDSKGQIEVTISVTGQPGPGTYLVRWNDRNERNQDEMTLESAGTVTFADVPTGETEVSLVEMPDGCSTDDVQEIVTVEDDTTVSVSFEVVCGA